MSRYDARPWVLLQLAPIAAIVGILLLTVVGGVLGWLTGAALLVLAIASLVKSVKMFRGG